jgi:streptogramin lyase
LFAGVAGNILPVQSQISTGDILVIDVDGTSGQGILFTVDPITGARTVLSDFSVGDNQGLEPISIAVEASGNILITDRAAGTGGNGALFRVDPITGARIVLSDFGEGDNQGQNPFDVAVEASGNILVVDPSVGNGGQGTLFRIDPITGARTVLSDFGEGDNQGQAPVGVAVEDSGSILVIDRTGSTGQGALFRVNPFTGERTLLSDFGVGDNQGVNPYDVAVEASGNILVIDFDDGTNDQGALFRVNPITGERTLLSDFGFGANQGESPLGVAVEASGNILVIDQSAGTGSQGDLFRVNPITGERTLLSDFGVGDNQGENPWGVAVYPVIPAAVGGIVTPVNKFEMLAPYLALAGLVAGITAVFAIRKRRGD